MPEEVSAVENFPPAHLKEGGRVFYCLSVFTSLYSLFLFILWKEYIIDLKLNKQNIVNIS